MAKRNTKVKHASMSDVVVPSPEEPAQEPKRRGKVFWCCGILLLVFILLIVAYFALTQNLAHRYLMDGREKFDQHLYTEANRDYVFASALSFFGKQTDADAYDGVALIADLRGDLELSAENYHKALQASPSDDLRQKYATKLFQLNKFSDAADEFAQIQNPNDTVLLFLGGAYLRQDNFEKAKETFEKISDEQDQGRDRQLSYFALRDHDKDFLKLYPESGISEAAFRSAAEKALQGKPYTAVEFVTLGNLLLGDGQYDFALDFANSALELENNYRDAFVLQAQAYLARTQYDLAHAAINKAIEISLLNKDFWQIKAKIFEAQKNIDEALKAYKKAGELGEDSAEFHFAFAKAAREDKDYDTALLEVKKSIAAVAPLDVYLEFWFWTAYDAENFQEMDAAAKKYVEQYPNAQFGTAAKALADYKLQKRTNFSDVIYLLDPTSAFEKYLEAIDSMDQHVDFDKNKTKQLLTEAIDFDTEWGSDFEIGKRAQILLGHL